MPNRRKNRPDHDLDALDDPLGDSGERLRPTADGDGVFHNITWTYADGGITADDDWESPVLEVMGDDGDHESLVNNEVIEGVFKFGVAPKPDSVEDLLGGRTSEAVGRVKYEDITLQSLGRENSIECLTAEDGDGPDGFVITKELDKSSPLLAVDAADSADEPEFMDYTDDAAE